MHMTCHYDRQVTLYHVIITVCPLIRWISWPYSHRGGCWYAHCVDFRPLWSGSRIVR